MGNKVQPNPKTSLLAKKYCWKMTSLQTCWIKKITQHTGQTFWDHQLCFYVKKYLLVKKYRKVTLSFFIGDLCHQFFFSWNSNLLALGKTLLHNSLKKNEKVTFLWFYTKNSFYHKNKVDGLKVWGDFPTNLESI